MPRIAILASGSGSTAEALITACASGRIPGEIAIIIGNNSASEVFARAARLAVPARHLSGVTHPEPSALDAAILRTLREVAATHIVLAGYMKKVGPLTLHAFAGRIFNTHPALLPTFGGQGMFGRNVHRAVLESGASTTGATVHHVQADYDTGPVISQVEVPVSASDTIDTLADRVQQAERELLIRTLRTILINDPG
ncbi:MAG TPA: phosphoribosylglycinamide formyltransferase [Streptosporangiaceae bacterium]|nr:phosphoribosylglycinamide formyltransferase [Streptosporangiaceae bacterium]